MRVLGMARERRRNGREVKYWARRQLGNGRLVGFAVASAVRARWEVDANGACAFDLGVGD